MFSCPPCPKQITHLYLHYHYVYFSVLFVSFKILIKMHDYFILICLFFPSVFHHWTKTLSLVFPILFAVTEAVLVTQGEFSSISYLNLLAAHELSLEGFVGGKEYVGENVSFKQRGMWETTNYLIQLK